MSLPLVSRFCWGRCRNHGAATDFSEALT